jgi:hypothetical protein
LDYKSYLRPIRANAMEERSPAEANGSCWANHDVYFIPLNLMFC